MCGARRTTAPEEVVRPDPGEAESDPGGRSSEAPDFRMVVPAVGAWGIAAIGVTLPAYVLIIAAVLAGLLSVAAAYRTRRLAAVMLVVSAATCVVTGLRLTAASSGPVFELADAGAFVRITMQIKSDPRPYDGSFADGVVFQGQVTYVEGRGTAAETREPVLVFAPKEWVDLRLGQSIAATGILEPSESTDNAAVLDAHGAYEVVEKRQWWWVATDRLRSGVGVAVAQRSDDVASLVPALVHGDDRDLPQQLTDDFRASGLTHLLAVSGTNLTLVVGFLLLIARQCGVRGRGRMLLGIAGTVGFVLLARPEPSVVRAAAMGLVALAGLGAGGARRGLRSLSWAVIGLLLLDPWLSRTAGFTLSVCATAGILVLAPRWRDRLARWMPRWCAEAIAIPLAAQLACTPVVAVISRQVSLVAVIANLLAAPAVGPATVLGLLGGVVAMGSQPVAEMIGRLTAIPAGWIATVGHQAAALPGAAIEWDTGPAAIAGLILICLAIGIGLGWALSRPWICVPLAILLMLVLIRPVSPGWPPPGWVAVMCDVGQGDATVLNAGDGQGVVIDTGPDPRSVDHCLSRLGIERVPLIVLTHPHRDHIGGLRGVLDGRDVGAVAVSEVAGSPPTSVPLRRLSYASRHRIGDVTWTVLGPEPGDAPVGDSGDTGESAAVNDASVVLLAEIDGVSILLTGDIEPAAQAAVLDAAPEVTADVLKVPHHGSAGQEPELFEQVDADYALFSVGAENSYGHPAASTLELARAAGMRNVRTDESGDLAVVADDGEPRVLTR